MPHNVRKAGWLSAGQRVSCDSREGEPRHRLQGWDDNARARAASLQVKLLLKMAAETRFPKQKDIQIETGLLPLPWGLRVVPFSAA